MKMRVDASRSTARDSSGYVLLETVPTQLALPASSVLNVVRATEWNGDLPIPLDTVVPIQFATTEPCWILSVGALPGTMAIIVTGSLRLNYVYPDSLLPMPMQNTHGFGYFSGMILADGKPSALIINLDALHQAHLEMDS